MKKFFILLITALSGLSVNAASVRQVGEEDILSRDGSFRAQFLIKNDEKTPLVVKAVKLLDWKCKILKSLKEPIAPGNMLIFQLECKGLQDGFFSKSGMLITNQQTLSFKASGKVQRVKKQARSLQARLKSARKVCLSRDWSKKKCSFKSPKQWWDYRTNFGDRVAETLIVQSLYGVSDLAKYLYQHSLSPTGLRPLPSKGEVALAVLEKELQEYANEKSMTDCGRVCLAKCFSANLMDYQEEGPQPYASQILENGQGVCREYSILGDHIAEALGVNSRITADIDFGNKSNYLGHAFLTVRLGKKKYFAEPQDSSCTFIRME